MQPLQYDLRDPAAKDNSITNAATARSNLDAAITMRSAETELQNRIELRATASEIVAPKPDGSRRQSKKKTILKHFLKGLLEGKSLVPKWRKSADKSRSQPSCSHSNTIYEVRKQPWRSHYNAICKDWAANRNPIYIAGTILQLQNRMEFHRQLIHQQHLQSHLHCGNDPTVANHNGIPSATHPPAPLAIPFTLRERSYSCKSQWNSVDRTCTKNSWNPIYNAEPIRAWSAHDPTTHETVSQPSHRRGRSLTFGDGLCMEKHRVSCICYLSKTHFVRDFLQNSIGNSSTSTTCNAILTLSLTNSFPDILKVTINSVPN